MHAYCEDCPNIYTCQVRARAEEGIQEAVVTVSELEGVIRQISYSKWKDGKATRQKSTREK